VREVEKRIADGQEEEKRTKSGLPHSCTEQVLTSGGTAADAAACWLSCAAAARASASLTLSFFRPPASASVTGRRAAVRSETSMDKIDPHGERERHARRTQRKKRRRRMKR
jgi:hypothetical protein